MHLSKYNEDYLITLPSLHIEGLIYGSPFVELNKATYIQSSSGYTAKIDYSGKGWLSGKKNSFTATLYPEQKEKDILYEISGQWTDTFVIRDSKKREVDTYCARNHKTTPLIVAPLDQQDLYETRRAWHNVAEAITRGDMDTTSIEKSKIENSQRELRKKEQAEGREWERKFFSRVPSDPIFDRLAAVIGEKSEPERTGGVWRFDVNKAEKAKEAIPFIQGHGTRYGS